MGSGEERVAPRLLVADWLTADGLRLYRSNVIPSLLAPLV